MWTYENNKNYYYYSYVIIIRLLQRGRIACNAGRCDIYGNSVCPSVCHTLVPYLDE